ncbi:MAG: HEPN domain-containing protein [Chloroflexi bacterium]|nr:MAG: HEPN domain-containing protein [Chloroflexota bacterium]
MPSPRTLRQLVDEGAIEKRAVGQQQIAHWLSRSRKDLRLAAHASRTGDSERAMTIAYEAGLRACIAILAAAGYRLRSGEGHHRAALDGALTIAGSGVEVDISRLNDARRQRNESLYATSRPVGAEELKRLVASVEALIKRAQAGRS